MPYSSGTFSRVHDFTSDRDAGIKIQASRTDAEFDGIATALSTAILKDGTQTTTAVIPFAFGISIVDNKAITLGTNSDITIQYDETTNDSLEIAAAVEGAALGIVLKSDQGDDNADQHKLSIADGGTLTLASKISGSFVTYLTHTPNSTVASSTLAVAGNLTVGGNLTLGSGAELSEAELEMLDGITAGTVAASKAVVVDANKDIASFRNITLTGELDAGSLDVSGDADIDGTLEADAMTLNGSAITTTATLSTGISNGNVLVATSGVADNDFLRVDGTSIEGRSASEVLSDIGASAVAGSSSIVTTGALDSGSITSGFGNIDTGSSTITTTGAISGGTLTGSTSIKTPLIEFTDGDDALTIADGGHVTANANLTVSGAFTSQGIDDNADATAITINSSEQVGIGTTSPATSLHVLSSSAQTIARLAHPSSSTAAVNGGALLQIENTNNTNGNQSSLIFADSTGAASSGILGFNTDHSSHEGFLKFGTRNSGGTFAERMRVASGGDVTISDGNLVIGTAGHGIDFSATSDGTTMSSEILDNYEEGLWDATLEPQTSGSVNMLNNACQYTKIGSMVYLSGSVSTNSASSPVGVMKLGGFPYAISNLTDLAGRSIGTINIQAAAITPVLYGLWLEEGDSFGLIYNFSTSSEQPAGTAANNFSGNETIYFSAIYRTT